MVGVDNHVMHYSWRRFMWKYEFKYVIWQEKLKGHNALLSFLCSFMNRFTRKHAACLAVPICHGRAQCSVCAPPVCVLCPLPLHPRPLSFKPQMFPVPSHWSAPGQDCALCLSVAKKPRKSLRGHHGNRVADFWGCLLHLFMSESLWDEQGWAN